VQQLADRLKVSAERGFPTSASDLDIAFAHGP
jgi:hypothetical protein